VLADQRSTFRRDDAEVARTMLLNSSRMHQQTQLVFDPVVDWQPMQFKLSVVLIRIIRSRVCRSCIGHTSLQVAAFWTRCNGLNRYFAIPARMLLQ